MVTTARLADRPYTVGAVDHVDAGPDQDDDEQQVHRIRQGEAPLQELHAAAVEVEVGHACHHGDDKVDDAFFVLVPGLFGGIVKVAGEHGSDEQHGVDDIFYPERQECQRHQRDAQHEDQAGTAGLALGQAAIDGKFTAMVVGKLVVEQRIGKRSERNASRNAAASTPRCPTTDTRDSIIFLFSSFLLQFMPCVVECITPHPKNQSPGTKRPP